MSSTVTAPTTDASVLSTGTVALARLGTGTPDPSKFLRGDNTWAVPAGGGGGGSGTVTSVALALPTSELTVTGSPVTGAGTLSAAWATQTANRVFAAPDGSNGAPSFRALAAGDIPNLSAAKVTSGTLPVARGGTGLSAIAAGKLVYASATDTLAELSLGSGLSISGGTLSAAGGGGGSGTVTSVAMTVPTGEFGLSGSPVTSAGTLALTWQAQTTNKVLAAPNGSTGAPTFRVLAAADIPGLAASKITSGTLDAARLPTGIDAASIGGGSVSNTEFGFLDGVTSGIQAQINALSGGGGGGSYLPLSGGTMAGAVDMGGNPLTHVAEVHATAGSFIAEGYTTFLGDGINFGWLTSYSAGEFQSLSGGVPAPMFFDSTEIRFRGSGYAALATLNAAGLTMPSGGVVEAPAGFVGPGTCPTGCVVPYLGGYYPPDGWLKCDGSDVSRSTYSDLFALIGTAYGSGDGTYTFGLPSFGTSGPGSTHYLVKT